MRRAPPQPRNTQTRAPHSADVVTFQTYHGPTAAGQSATQPTLHRIPLGRVDYLLATALFVTAFLVRWPLIERGETLLHPDEAIVGIMAQDIAAGQRFPVYFYGQRYMGALEAYVIAALSFVCQNPIHALRLGPTCFFAILVALQYLMLTRWFGRTGGLLGAATLLAGSPMFAQWSISARGGYIEVLVWGSALLWAYFEWFAGGAASSVRRRFLFGLLIGSGLWINPSIVFFLVPLLAHALLRTSWRSAAERATVTRWIGALVSRLDRAALPVVALAGIAVVNVIWSVSVEDNTVRSSVFLDALPKPASFVLLNTAGGCAALLLLRHTGVRRWLRGLLQSSGLAILGALAGALPAVIYVLSHVVRRLPLEPALPLGFRPIWSTGETLVYFLRGLPLWFGADPRPFIDLVTVGRDRTIAPLNGSWSNLIAWANCIVCIGVVVWLMALLIVHRQAFQDLLRLRSGNYGPTTVLLLGMAGTISLFLLGGCSCSFTTIRYLLPLWAFLPGLIGAACTVSRYRRIAIGACLALLAAWGYGQAALYQQIGGPHPLHRVADSLVRGGVATAEAEILDAHLLSYLTGQRCRVEEFEPFWPRLSHYSHGSDSGVLATTYVVNTSELDRTSDWTDAGWPGPPPPETQRFLWPAMHKALLRRPDLLLQRRPLGDDYELLTLRRPLRENGHR